MIRDDIKPGGNVAPRCRWSPVFIFLAAMASGAVAQSPTESQDEPDPALEALLAPDDTQDKQEAKEVTDAPADESAEDAAAAPAQSEPDLSTIPVPERAAEPVKAEAEKPRPSHVEEIVVTVSKRKESLQDVLGSVSAFSGEMLQENNVQDFASLVELMPGVVAQDEDKIAIRGVSRTRDGPSPVAFHVNDVFIGTRGELFYDLAAVEILRGPSGTLFGRNATAGAINAKWRRPEGSWSTGGELRYSGLQERQLRAYVNLPLLGEDDPRLLARIAALWRSSDGTMDNMLVDDSEDPNNADERFARIYLTSEPTDNLRLGLRAIRNESTPGGAPGVASPSLETRRSGELERLGAQPLPDDLRKVRSTAHERFGETHWQFTRVDGDSTWSLQELPVLGNVDLVAVGGVFRNSGVGVYDLDGTEEPIVDVRARGRSDVRRTGELRLVSQNDSGFDWLMGVFWYRQTAVADLDVAARTFVKLSDVAPIPPVSGQPEFRSDVQVVVRNQRSLDYSKAVFLNLDFDLAKLFDGPPVQITAGLRNNWDEFWMHTESSDILIDFGAGPTPFVQERDIEQAADFVAPTGELGARWFYSDEGMAYVKLARGYKPGRAQRIARPNGEVVQNPVDPEYLDAVEAGWKSEFFDRRLMVNLAAFLYDYTDLQVSQITPGGVITENAASATIKGVELEMQWSPSEAFRLQASAGWMEATYDQYCGNDSARGEVPTDPGCTDENPTDFSGQRLPAAPRYSTALLASYTWSLGRFGSLTPSFKTNWTDGLDRRGLGNPHDQLEAYTLSDVRLAWKSPEGRWKAEAFVENLEDHDDKFFQSYTPLAVGGRPDTFTLLSDIPPRVFGMTLEANFQ